MLKRFAVLLFLLVVPRLFAAEDPDLLERLRPVVSEQLPADQRVIATTYSHYASGRPRLVVAGSMGDNDDGEIVLVRFPDRAQRAPVVLQRLKVDRRPVEIGIVRVTDPKNVMVTFFGRHTPASTIYRLVGQRLVEIAHPDAYWGLIAVDLDGDRVPELLSTGCCDPTPCGTGIFLRLDRYNGTTYEGDGREYIDYVTAHSGKPSRDGGLLIPWPDDEQTRKRYIIHLFNDGATSARVSSTGAQCCRRQSSPRFSTSCGRWRSISSTRRKIVTPSR